jgi:hypothetical protein
MIYGKNLRKADQLKYNNSGHLPCLGKLLETTMWRNMFRGDVQRETIVYVSLMLGDVEVSFLASRLVNCSR